MLQEGFALAESYSIVIPVLVVCVVIPGPLHYRVMECGYSLSIMASNNPIYFGTKTLASRSDVKR